MMEESAESLAGITDHILAMFSSVCLIVLNILRNISGSLHFFLDLCKDVDASCNIY